MRAPTCTTQRGGAIGPHAHGHAARHGVDDLNVQEIGQQKPENDPRNNQHNPQCANYWAPLTRKRHHTEHRPQRPSEHSDPMQHAKGRTGDCPGPRKETATRRNVTQGSGEVVCCTLSLACNGAWGWGLSTHAYRSFGVQSGGSKKEPHATPPSHTFPHHMPLLLPCDFKKCDNFSAAIF